MDSRERVTRTLTFARSDRIPVHLWTLPGTVSRYGERLRRLLDSHPQDIIDTDYRDPLLDPRHYKAGEYQDAWGCTWRNLQDGIIGEVKQAPLSDLRALTHYRAPLDSLAYGWDRVAESVKRRRDRFCLGGNVSLFERMQFLRGTENLMMDLAEGRPEADTLLGIVFDFYKKFVGRWLEFDIDGVGFFDDWGHQSALLISPSIWRRVFKPAYRQLIQTVKASGRFVFFHSDGHISEIYQDLIDLGVDALNSQLWCMGVPELASRFAGKVTFWGEISRQDILPKGTPSDVRAAAQLMKDRLFVNGGGLIGQSEAGPDVPFENIRELLLCWNDGSR
ncbi:MAG: hypothetical protein HYY08_03620 [Firmicutes bacterium]|nr:hypothetical protein [Bacillota bacterium]